jgi:hypothetical protein
VFAVGRNEIGLQVPIVDEIGYLLDDDGLRGDRIVRDHLRPAQLDTIRRGGVPS